MTDETESSAPGTGPYNILETEMINPATKEIDRMSPLEIVEVMNQEDAKVALGVKTELPQIARAIEGIAERLRRGGRLIYMGAGTSGRLGLLDAVECPPTFNLPPHLVVGCLAGGWSTISQAAEDLEDSAESGKADLVELSLNESDVVVGISASGRTLYVHGGILYAREIGTLTIGIACNKNSPLEKVVDIMIAPVVGPEVINGSTRLKAGTAQKMILNMLSTGSMVLLGKTYGNLMVDVQATNHKLHERALEIVRQVTGLDKDKSRALLLAADGEVKTAILMGQSNLTPAEARERLITHGHNLRMSLGDKV